MILLATATNVCLLSKCNTNNIDKKKKTKMRINSKSRKVPSSSLEHHYQSHIHTHTRTHPHIKQTVKKKVRSFLRCPISRPLCYLYTVYVLAYCNDFPKEERRVTK